MRSQVGVGAEASQRQVPTIMTGTTPPGVLVLDGGMGHLLKSHDIAKFAPHLPPERQFAAAALANAAAPQLILSAHEAYIQSGCDVITANTFGCTRWSLQRAEASGREAELAALGAALARQAAQGTGVLVAGASIGRLRRGCRDGRTYWYA